MFTHVPINPYYPQNAAITEIVNSDRKASGFSAIPTATVNKIDEKI